MTKPADNDTAQVAAAVEALRTAMFAGDGKALAALTFDQLAYVHSNARHEDKATYIRNLDGRTAFHAMVQSDQVIEVVGDNAIVRHTFDCINNFADGKTGVAHVRILQVWKRDNGAWKLLARQATPQPQ